MWNAFGAVGQPEDEIYRLFNFPSDNDKIKEQWNHWAMTKDTTTGSMKMYCNGALIASGSNKTSLPPAATDVTIGNSCSHSSGYDGRIDDLRIYEQELTQPEIVDVMNALPDNAHEPSPAHKSVDQDVISVSLAWSAGEAAVSHNVHFGTDPCSLTEVSTEQGGTVYALDELDLATIA